MGFNCLSVTEQLWGDSLLFTTNFPEILLLLRSISKQWKAEMKASNVCELVYQPSYCQIWIKVAKCQTDSIMTLNCELRQSEFSVLSCRLFIKLPKICFLCTYVDQMIIQQRFNVLLEIQCYNIFTNILSVSFKCSLTF